MRPSNRLLAIVLLLAGMTCLWSQGCLAGRSRAAAGGQPSGLQDERFGVTGGLSGATANARVKELGVGWVRIPVNWGQIEPQPGRYRWDKVEQALQNQRKSAPGVRVMVTVRATAGAEELASPGKTRRIPSSPPRDLQAYHDFLYEFATRGRGTVDCWQIENEPDSKTWWTGTAPEYLELLRVAHRAIRAADPGAKIALGGFTSEILTIAALDAQGVKKEEIARQLGHRGQIGAKEIAAARANVAKVEAILAGAKDLVDVVDVHLYNDYQAIPARVAWVRSRMRAHGYEKPIWATEIGGPDSLLSPYSDRAQSEELVKRIALTLSSGVEKVFWLGMIEMETQGERFNRLGLVRKSGEVKPAFRVYQGLIRSLQNLDYQGTVPVPNGAGFRFGRGEKALWILWADQKAEAELATSAPKLRVTQLTGHTRVVAASRGLARIPLTSSPVIVEPAPS